MAEGGEPALVTADGIHAGIHMAHVSQTGAGWFTGSRKLLWEQTVDNAAELCRRHLNDLPMHVDRPPNIPRKDRCPPHWRLALRLETCHLAGEYAGTNDLGGPEGSFTGLIILISATKSSPTRSRSLPPRPSPNSTGANTLGTGGTDPLFQPVRLDAVQFLRSCEMGAMTTRDESRSLATGKRN